MRLWSIQTLAAWKELQERGTLRAQRRHATWDGEKDVPSGYTWMMEQMKIRVGPPPAEDIYPVWAWAFYGPVNPRPDLRRISWHWGNADPELVMIELEVEDNQVLVSDFDAFHAALNNWHLPFNEADREKFKALQLTKEDRGKAIRESWQRMFTPEALCRDYWGPGRPTLQACLWEFPKSAVVSHKIFRNRAYKQSA